MEHVADIFETQSVLSVSFCSLILAWKNSNSHTSSLPCFFFAGQTNAMVSFGQTHFLIFCVEVLSLVYNYN